MHVGNANRKKCQPDRMEMQTAAAAAVALLLVGLTPQAKAGNSTGMITWSISGSTAMRNFTVGVPGTSSGGLTLYETGSPTLTLSNGTYTPGSGGLQLAPSPYTGTALAGSSGDGVRVEYHESGSVEGIEELANDQIGFVGGASGGAHRRSVHSRNPTGGNPIWVNRNKLTSTTTANGYSIGTSNYNTYLDYTTLGTNTQGGQDRVQMAISDVVPIQGFATTSGGNTPPPARRFTPFALAITATA